MRPSLITILLALLSASVVAQDNQRITLDPDPPKAGKTVTVSYAFDDTQVETILRFWVWRGDGLVCQFDQLVCFLLPDIELDLPPGATSMLIEDVGGPSPDKAAVIET